MVWRWVTVKDRETIADSEIDETDLRGLGAISALWVEQRADNGATSNRDNHPFHTSRRLEVRDGAQVFYSLRGIETQAYDWLIEGEMPPDELTEAASATQAATFVIPYGRWVGDPLYYFQAGIQRNPKLFSDINLAEIRAVGATGFATGTGRISVWAFADESLTSPAPQGYIRSTEQKNFTSAASGDDITELPVERPYFNLMVRAKETAIAYDATLTRVVLDFDIKRLIYVDMRPDEIAKLNARIVGNQAIINKTAFVQDADTTDIYIGDPIAGSANPTVTNRQGLILSFAGDQATIDLTDLAVPGNIAARESLRLQARGWAPHNAINVPFGFPPLKENFFPAQNFRRSQLRLTQGNAGADVRVVLSEITRQTGA